MRYAMTSFAQHIALHDCLITGYLPQWILRYFVSIDSVPNGFIPTSFNLN